MSFSKIKTKLYNLETLKQSLTDLNIEWTTEAKQVRGYQEYNAFSRAYYSARK